MRVLVVGSCGREHALAWAISASPLVDRLFCAPGNAGIAEEAECLAIGATDIKGVVQFCRNERIDFVVVGPEAPLVLGLVDALEAEGIPAFGPSAAAAAPSWPISTIAFPIGRSARSTATAPCWSFPSKPLAWGSVAANVKIVTKQRASIRPSFSGVKRA